MTMSDVIVIVFKLFGKVFFFFWALVCKAYMEGAYKLTSPIPKYSLGEAFPYTYSWPEKDVFFYVTYVVRGVMYCCLTFLFKLVAFMFMNVIFVSKFVPRSSTLFVTCPLL